MGVGHYGVIHGACGLDADDAYEASRLSGADGLAEAWATARSVPVERYPAAWKRYGRSAGPRRNTIMVLKVSDLCVAFPGGRGTKDMVRKARIAGVRVIQVLWDGTMQEGG